MVHSPVTLHSAYLAMAHALLRVTYFKIQSHYLIHVVFHLVLAGVYWHKIDVIYACAFAEQSKYFSWQSGALAVNCYLILRL